MVVGVVDDGGVVVVVVEVEVLLVVAGIAEVTGKCVDELSVLENEEEADRD